MSVQKIMSKETEKGEKRQISFEEFLEAIMNDIDPAKYAGEGQFSVDEYARPADIENPWVRADVIREGEYYPGPDIMNKMRGY